MNSANPLKDITGLITEGTQYDELELIDENDYKLSDLLELL